MPRGPKEQPWIKWSPERMALVKSLRLKGYTIPEIAEIMDETRNTINGVMLRKVGYPSRRELAKSAWQPIETAPKDGTSVFLYWPNAKQNKFIVGAFKVREGLSTTQKRWIAAYPNLRPKPTHWMPLPEPPK